jgi:hypothetical protein
MQVNMDEEEGIPLDVSKNEFLNEQGFEAKLNNDY